MIFSPDGSKAYVANQTFPPYYISIIDTATNTVSGLLTRMCRIHLAVWLFSLNGTKLYFTGISSTGQPVVAIIDTATNTFTDTIVLRKSTRLLPGQPAITPNGKFLYVPLSNGRSISEGRHGCHDQNSDQQARWQVDCGKRTDVSRNRSEWQVCLRLKLSRWNGLGNRYNSEIKQAKTSLNHMKTSPAPGEV